jgi:alcohol dehydrogenase class IV
MANREFKFFTPTRLIFGEGCARQTGRWARDLGGTKALLVTDKGLVRAGLSEEILKALRGAGLETIVFDGVKENPTEQNVHDGRDLIGSERIDVVIAVGGGSPMDAAKAMSALSAAEGSIVDYEYGLKFFTRSGPPVIAIPTTAGTGSEATMGSVITDQASHRKIDVVSPLMAPRVSLVDPELTYSLPPAITAATGMDALTHSVEGYTASLASPLTDSIHLCVIGLLGRFLLRAYTKGTDTEARHNVMLASMMAGVGFPNSGLGAVHGLTLPLGGRFGVAHGIGNAIMLPHVMSFNLPACAEKLADIALPLGAKKRTAEAAIEQVIALRRAMGIPVLSSFSVSRDSLPALAKDALGRNTNCVTNPRAVSEKDAIEMYAAALAEPAA